MALNEKIAASLSRIQALMKENGSNIVRSGQLLRKDRELLVRIKWLQEILKGWYLVVKPDILPGDSSAWYASFWDFLQTYLHYHFDNRYCLSAESSLDLHTGSTTIPKQVVVITAKGGGSAKNLPFDTSIFIYSDPKNLPEETMVLRGLQVMTIPFALCKVSFSYFQKNPKEAEIALRLIRSSQEISPILLKYNFKSVASRLIGAFEFLGCREIAQEIKTDLSGFGWKINEENPFSHRNALLPPLRYPSPYAARILTLWSEYREKIISIFPSPPGLPKNQKAYLDHLEEIYEEDAYHSLSIEGYQIDEALIAKVQNNAWNPELHPQGRAERNALAARGYYEAFLEVKKSVQSILQGELPGSVVEKDVKKWMQKLFFPMVQVGLMRQEDLIGYRKSGVYIKNSRHVPVPKEALLDSMETFFECVKNEKNPAAAAVLGHYVFVYIHPYMDGNGRLGRFLMNTMFASGGYPWTIVRVKNRSQYLQALELITTEKTIEPFAQFILDQMRANSDLS